MLQSTLSLFFSLFVFVFVKHTNIDGVQHGKVRCIMIKLFTVRLILNLPCLEYLLPKSHLTCILLLVGEHEE